MDKITENIKKSSFAGTASLDPRCKLLLLISIGFVSYFINGDLPGLLLTAGFGIFIAAGSGMRWSVKMLLIYIIASYLNGLLRYLTVPGLSVIMNVFGVTVLKLLPIVMVGYWILYTTYIDDLIVSLQRMRVPQSITIPLAVLFRYLPTLAIEYRMIRNTMDIRGICDTWWKRVRHPILTVEYLLIPLLMRCLKVADELSASGTTRGMERQGTRYSLNNIRFSGRNYAVILATVIFLSSLLAADHSEIGEVMLWGR